MWNVFVRQSAELLKGCDYLPTVRFVEWVYNGCADVNPVILKEECFMLSTDTVSLSPNPLVGALGKPAKEFTKADIIGYIEDNGIRMLNLRYVGGDGRLKTLNFAIQSKAHLDRVLTLGERVDGSSLFAFVEATSSDLYVVPRLATSFLNPFSHIPTLDILCGFYDVDGKPLASAPQEILRKAQRALKEETGCELQALGELEYYLFSDEEDLFPVEPQRGYHESGPFSKWESVRTETLLHLVSMGCSVKYAHSEVGNFVSDGRQMVQQEIEFLPVDALDAADQMVLAKWVLREVAHSYGIHVSFSPKIAVGQAGSGMHFHTRLVKDGVNQFSTGSGLTETALKVIGGYLSHAASLTAFGNTVPTSFLRLVPHQEAPTAICWGDRNRSVLARVPLELGRRPPGQRRPSRAMRRARPSRGIQVEQPTFHGDQRTPGHNRLGHRGEREDFIDLPRLDQRAHAPIHGQLRGDHRHGEVELGERGQRRERGPACDRRRRSGQHGDPRHDRFSSGTGAAREAPP